MIKRYLILIPVFSLFSFVFFGLIAYAQVRNTDIVLSISPEFPSPNQSMTATLGSFSTDLDKAYISWSVNNQATSGGVGKKTFYFTTGDLGSSVNLSVTINTVDGQSIQKTMSIASNDVDMLWEASDSYTPPFYRGKTLGGKQGTFKVVAIPNIVNQGGKVNSANLSYVWTKDDNIQPDSSGWGKNYFIFQNSYLDKSNTIEVKISDITGNINTSSSVELKPIIPKIVFYKNDPLFGIQWNKEVNNGYRIDQSGETLVAEPYFFSPKNISSSDLSFSWFINGGQVQTSNVKNVLSVKPDAGQSGNAVIKVMVSNVKTLFQDVTKEVNVRF